MIHLAAFESGDHWEVLEAIFEDKKHPSGYGSYREVVACRPLPSGMKLRAANKERAQNLVLMAAEQLDTLGYDVVVEEYV